MLGSSKIKNCKFLFFSFLLLVFIAAISASFFHIHVENDQSHDEQNHSECLICNFCILSSAAVVTIFLFCYFIFFRGILKIIYNEPVIIVAVKYSNFLRAPPLSF